VGQGLDRRGGGEGLMVEFGCVMFCHKVAKFYPQKWQGISYIFLRTGVTVQIVQTNEPSGVTT